MKIYNRTWKIMPDIDKIVIVFLLSRLVFIFSLFSISVKTFFIKNIEIIIPPIKTY